MGYRFNPPPGWPQPPEGWTPPPGWQPDPSWPPAPQGWEFWVDDGAGQQAPASGAEQAGAAPGVTQPHGTASDAPTQAAGADTPAQTSDGGEAPTQAFDGGAPTQASGGAEAPTQASDGGEAPTQASDGGEAPTQAFDGGAPTQAFGAASGQQPPAGTPGAPGAPAAYQYQPSGHLDQPGASPYHGGAVPPAEGVPGQGMYQQGGPAQGSYAQAGYQQGGYQPAPPPGYAGAQSAYPGGPEGGYPGGPGAQGQPDGGKKSNAGIIIGIVVAVVLVLGLLIWGAVALFGGSDDGTADPVPQPVTTDPADPDPEPTEDPADPEPTQDPEPTEDPEPTDDPTDTNGDDGPAAGNGEVLLDLGEHALIVGEEDNPQVTLAVTDVQTWTAESGAFFCTDSELGEFIEISVEITTYDLAEPYEFSGVSMTVADEDRNTYEEVNPFLGILCDNPDRVESPLAANDTHTGSLILDVPTDATYVVWQDLFDFTGQAPTYMWEY